MTEDVAEDLDVTASPIPQLDGLNNKFCLDEEKEDAGDIVVVDANMNDESAVKESDEITIVHAEAIFRNSTYLNLMQDDLISLEKFILCEKHLQKNIAKIDYQVISNVKVGVQIDFQTVGKCQTVHFQTFGR